MPVRAARVLVFIGRVEVADTVSTPSSWPHLGRGDDMARGQGRGKIEGVNRKRATHWRAAKGPELGRNALWE
jgi:hypothetical protein